MAKSPVITSINFASCPTLFRLAKYAVEHRSDLASTAVHAAGTRARGAYMAFTHDRNFPIATIGRRVITADASRCWKSRKGPGNDDAYRRSLTSVLRYIAAGDHRRSLLENNRTSMCRGPSEWMYRRPLTTLGRIAVRSRKTSRISSSISAGNVTCRGYIATNEASCVLTHDDVKMSSGPAMEVFNLT